MPILVAFLRGINVGGNNKIPMADLKKLFDKLGFKNATTLLQSGNVVFQTESGTPQSFAKTIADGVRARFKAEIKIVVRTPDEPRKLVARNPFPDAARNDPSHLLVVFLEQTPSNAAAKTLAAARFADEHFHLSGSDLYAHYGAGIGISKVPTNFIDKTLGVGGTARNWNTVAKLIALATALEEV